VSVTVIDEDEGPELRPAVVLVDVRAERRGPMVSVVQAAIGDGTVAQVGTTIEALAAIERYHAYAAVVEVDADGAVIAALRAAHPALVIVVCTFRSDSSTRRQAEEAGSDAFLVKPVSTREIRTAIEAGRRAPLADTAVR
jgi:DNA-binding NarL/FixJ family response regulator